LLVGGGGWFGVWFLFFGGVLGGEISRGKKAPKMGLPQLGARAEGTMGPSWVPIGQTMCNGRTEGYNPKMPCGRSVRGDY